MGIPWKKIPWRKIVEQALQWGLKKIQKPPKG